MILLVKTLFFIRLKQGQRILKEVGLLRLLFLAGFLVFYTSVAWQGIKQFPYDTHLAVFWVLSTASLHLARKDRYFLAGLTGKGPALRVVYMAEYLVLALPLLVLLVLQFSWLAAAVLMAGSFSLALVPNTWKGRWRKTIWQWPFLRALQFEWAPHLRRFVMLYGLVQVLALAMSHQTVALPLALIAVTLLLLAVHLPTEPLAMLKAPGLTGTALLHKKLAGHLLLYTALVAPLVLVFVLRHQAYWYVMLPLVLAGLILQAFGVVFKYATYYPEAGRKANATILVLMACCYLTTYLMPVPLVMAVIYYQRARKNLKLYL